MRIGSISFSSLTLNAGIDLFLIAFFRYQHLLMDGGTPRKAPFPFLKKGDGTKRYQPHQQKLASTRKEFTQSTPNDRASSPLFNNIDLSSIHAPTPSPVSFAISEIFICDF